jgi:hypothetical protein
VTVTPENRYILEAEIERFRQRLRSGLLDAKQARAATVRLAEARDDLDEYDWGMIRHSLPADMSASQPLPSGPHPDPAATRMSRSAWSGWDAWPADPAT